MPIASCAAKATRVLGARSASEVRMAPSLALRAPMCCIDRAAGNKRHSRSDSMVRRSLPCIMARNSSWVMSRKPGCSREYRLTHTSILVSRVLRERELLSRASLNWSAMALLFPTSLPIFIPIWIPMMFERAFSMPWMWCRWRSFTWPHGHEDGASDPQTAAIPIRLSSSRRPFDAS